MAQALSLTTNPSRREAAPATCHVRYLSSINKGRKVVSPDGMMPKEGPTIVYGLFSRMKSATVVIGIDLGKTYINDLARIVNAPFKS